MELERKLRDDVPVYRHERVISALSAELFRYYNQGWFVLKISVK
jgi:hypothetical protein